MQEKQGLRMRTKNSLKNIAISLLLGTVVILANFIVQKVFIETLGLDLLGVNGLFTNIVAMLAVAELGLGSAIIYHLYQPLHAKDSEKISSLMHFYKRGYALVALSIIVLGIGFLPFLGMITGTVNTSFNTHIVFLLFIVNSAASYILSYKRSLLYADQKSYIINLVHLIALVILNAIQIGMLVATKDYYLFLVLRIIFTVLENVILNWMIDKRYTIDSYPGPISKALRRDIFMKIKGLLFHKVAGFITTGSTNIIISILLGIVTVGFYSNYLLIQTAINTLFIQASGAIRASIGNLLVVETQEASFIVFKRLQFAGQFLAILCVSVFFVASGSFVSLWLGDTFVFSVSVTAALALNIYLYLIRWIAFHNFKEAAGIFYEDRFVPLLEAAINIVASIVLIKALGLAGAFLGTAFSSLVVHMYSYPKFVYKDILGRSYSEYARMLISSFAMAFFAVGIAYWVSTLFHFDSKWLQLLANVACSLVIPVTVFFAFYRRTEEFKYYGRLLERIVRKRR